MYKYDTDAYTLITDCLIAVDNLSCSSFTVIAIPPSINHLTFEKLSNWRVDGGSTDTSATNAATVIFYILK